MGLLSVAGFLPVLASSSVAIGVQSSVGATARSEVAAPAVQGVTYERIVPPPAVIAVLEPAPPPPPTPEAPPAPVPEPAAAAEPRRELDAAPEAAEPPAPAPPAPPTEALAAVIPPEPPPSGLTGVGSGLAGVTEPVTAPVAELLPVPVVDEVVTPLIGRLLGG
jgi:hypothetical protein